MLLEGNSKQVLIIERSSFREPGTPGDDDLLLNVTVVVGGYSAADQDPPFEIYYSGWEDH